MSWIDKLAATYDCCVGANGLIPQFHTAMNAQVIVTLDEAGDFVDAALITEKTARSTIIPCTEESSSRTSGNAPHPLFDTLQYVAGDLACDVLLGQLPEKDRNEKIADFQKKFDLYAKQLQAWCESEYANDYVKIVFDYIRKKTLCHDLIARDLLPVDGNGALYLEKPKTKAGNGVLSPDIERAAGYPVYSAVTGDLTKTVILFEIEQRHPKSSVHLWEDFDVRNSWSQYCLSVIGESAPVGFCQILGRDAPLAKLHPKRIRNAADGAKILSANDTANFTYRGRFEDPMEASAISIEASQKAHSALRWLLEQQGTHEDSQYMVAWAVDSSPRVPDPAKDTAKLLEDDPFSAVKTTEPELPDTAEASAAALNRLIAGYSAKLNAKDLCFIVLDAATPGTLAVKLFRDLDGSLYLKNILNWHTECAWMQMFGKDRHFYGAPAPRDIVFAAYGNLKQEDSRIKSTVARLLPCIIDAAQIPLDLAECIFRRASAFDSDKRWEFNKNQGIACSVYRYNHKQERKYTMALDHELKSRDYLYGRLLAVADYLEYSALSSAEAARPTNAMRLMAHFAEHPFTTWRSLESSLLPYKIRLASNRRGVLVYLENVLGEIHQAFTQDDFTNNRPLSGEYLLGYYCQKADFFTKKTENEEPTENK